MSGSLVAACKTVAARAKAQTLRLPATSQTARLARRLDSLPSTEAGRRPADIETVARDIRRAIASGVQLTRRQVRQGAWCLWNPNTRLADDPAVLKHVLEQVSVAKVAGPFRSLASNYLDAFSPTDPTIARAAEVLSGLAGRWPGNWQRLHADYRLFHVDEGPRALARAVATKDRPPDAILADYGVSMLPASGNYVRAVTAALLAHLANGGEPDHERRLSKVQTYALTAKGTPRFGDMAREIAEAILFPFRGLKPLKPLLDRVLGVLVGALGDPRLSGAKWRLVPTGLSAMVKAWLVEQSLRQFLDVVGETTENRDQWRYRRAFWEGVHATGIVSDAWVAFGTKGARMARERFGKDVEFGTVEKLTADDKSVDPGHAVLFLQIGGALVTDWSHDGRCNIWSESRAPGAPSLYTRRYRSNEIMIPGKGHTIEPHRMAVTHSSPETYAWQSRVAERLYEITGRRITQKDYQI